VESCERKYIQNLLDKSSWIPNGTVQKDGMHTTQFENITNNLVQPWCSYLERIEFLVHIHEDEGVNNINVIV
jgi:hypothetical protein